MQTLIASDDVTDAIVQIEMHRMEMQKETGAIGAGNEALRRLHEKNEYRCRSGATAPARFRPRHRSRLRERNNAGTSLTNGGTSDWAKWPNSLSSRA